MRAAFLFLVLSLLCMAGCAGPASAGPLCQCGPACACPDCDCLWVGVDAGMQGIDHNAPAKPKIPITIPDEILAKMGAKVDGFFGRMENVIYWDAFWRGAVTSAIVLIALVVLYLALTRSPDRKLPGG